VQKTKIKYPGIFLIGAASPALPPPPSRFANKHRVQLSANIIHCANTVVATLLILHFLLQNSLINCVFWPETEYVEFKMRLYKKNYVQRSGPSPKPSPVHTVQYFFISTLQHIARYRNF
jgi:hypothetical protein